MRWLTIGLLVLLGSCLATGCSLMLDKNGEIGFAFNTEWKLYHQTGEAGTAKIELDVQPALEFIADMKDDEADDGDGE